MKTREEHELLSLCEPLGVYGGVFMCINRATINTGHRGAVGCTVHPPLEGDVLIRSHSNTYTTQTPAPPPGQKRTLTSGTRTASSAPWTETQRHIVSTDVRPADVNVESQ